MNVHFSTLFFIYIIIVSNGKFIRLNNFKSMLNMLNYIEISYQSNQFLNKCAINHLQMKRLSGRLDVGFIPLNTICE